MSFFMNLTFRFFDAINDLLRPAFPRAIWGMLEFGRHLNSARRHVFDNRFSQELRARNITARVIHFLGQLQIGVEAEEPRIIAVLTRHKTTFNAPCYFCNPIDSGVKLS